MDLLLILNIMLYICFIIIISIILYYNYIYTINNLKCPTTTKTIIKKCNIKSKNWKDQFFGSLDENLLPIEGKVEDDNTCSIIDNQPCTVGNMDTNKSTFMIPYSYEGKTYNNICVGIQGKECKINSLNYRGNIILQDTSDSNGIFDINGNCNAKPQLKCGFDINSPTIFTGTIDNNGDCILNT